MKNRIKVILVDDHAVVRAGFRMLLSTDDAIEVIAEAERGEQACQLYLENKPDVMVLDLSMPGIGGLETIRRMCNRDCHAKILVFSVHDERVYVDRAMNAGAKGYISKHAHPEIMIAAIQKIALGEVYIERGLISDGNNVFSSQRPETSEAEYKSLIESLSAREFDVFLLLAKGLTAHKIAGELCLGYKTVANYGTQIRSKFKVSSAAELAHIAIISGVMKN
ncbi:MAG: response regulator transcription factor [Methylococcales bacterium]|nr:response regulator transcription factor [Methylococcales bacterium]